MIDMNYVQEEFAWFSEYTLVFKDATGIMYKLDDGLSALKSISFFANSVVYELQTPTKSKRKRVPYTPLFTIPESEDEFKYFLRPKRQNTPAIVTGSL